MWWFPDRRLIRAVTRVGAFGNFPIGSPTRMVIIVQPPGAALSGAVLSSSPIIAFMDNFGNIVPNVGVVVTATPSVGTMSGTTAVVSDGTGAATFSNLIFDDIVNVVVGERTITFTCPGFTNVVSTPVVVTKASLKLWMEADYGVVDANGAPMTSWADRSPTATAVTPAPTKSAPVFRSSGFGGSSLPYWDYLNSHAAKTPQLAALALTTSTEFYVAQRDPADANCAIALLVSDTINHGLQDAAASVYASRWNAGHTILLESSYNQPAGWIPKGSRQIFRHEMGGTHATHKVFLNGVQQVLPDQFVSNPGLVASSAVEARLGYRDVTLPALDLLGQFAAAMVFTPMLSAPEATSVETYLAKWLAAGPAVPTAFRGPILLASQVIDGVTVNVSLWKATGVPDFGSQDLQFGRLVFSFSEPIKRFRATLVFGQSAPQGIQWYRLIMGVRNLVGPYSWDYVTGGGYPPVINNQTVQINDTVTGFTDVITQLAPISGSGFIPTSVFKDCYFSKMSDP